MPRDSTPEGLARVGLVRLVVLAATSFNLPATTGHRRAVRSHRRAANGRANHLKMVRRMMGK